MVTKFQPNSAPASAQQGAIEGGASTPCALDDYISRVDFCRRFRISMRTAELMAHRGTGPRVTHLGKRAFYHVADIEQWANAQRAKSEARYTARRDV